MTIDVHRMAVHAVCADGNEPTTILQQNMVRLLEDFGVRVMDATFRDLRENTPEALPRDVEELLSRIFDGEKCIEEGNYTPERAWHMALAQARRINERRQPQSRSE